MRTLLIDCERLVQALLTMYRVGASNGSAYVTDEPALVCRLIHARVTTEAPGAGPALDPRIFLAPGDYAWGEPGKGTGPGGEWTARDEQEAEDRIEQGLLDEIEISGERFRVLCTRRTLVCAEAAEIVGASPITMRTRCQRGEFPNARREGRDWFIPAGDLIHWERRRPGPRRKTSR